MDKLTLEIVTPEGVSFEEGDIDGVVVRRREEAELGSEMAILPRHGPMLARIAACTLRFYQGGKTSYVDVGGGFMEVLRDKVTIVTAGQILVNGQAQRRSEA